jgi:hypothetical protein
MVCVTPQDRNVRQNIWSPPNPARFGRKFWFPYRSWARKRFKYLVEEHLEEPRSRNLKGSHTPSSSTPNELAQNYCERIIPRDDV